MKQFETNAIKLKTKGENETSSVFNSNGFSVLLILCLLILGESVQAQFWTRYDLEGGNGNGTLDKAWVGGLDNPQFSGFDFDQDGNMDLFVFDRKGDKALTFLYDASAGGASYIYAPEYEEQFPDLINWALIEDFNCDGIGDIFTYRNGGVILYTGSYDGTSFSFSEDTNKLKYDEAGFIRAIEISDFDVPEVEDVDGDGDLDILTFNPSGGFVEFFENRAAANGDPCGLIDFELTDECWGDFYESGLSTKVSLYAGCKGGGAAERGGVHAGSTLMTFDEDGDGDLELVLGDLNFGNLTCLINGGDADVALMTGQDTLFPSYSQPYLQPQFPAAFSYDVDHDGREDMIVAPNSKQLGAGRSNVWYYEDSGTDTVRFNFQMDSFLVGDMFDLGTGAAPVFFDHNGDGLLDIVAGSIEDNGGVSSLSLFENTGTATDPAFTLITMDYMNLSIYGFAALHPDFGDMDGDGDMDMLVGEEEGKLHLFINNPSGSTASFGLAAPNYMGIDVGMAATPDLVDLDRDGDLDIVIGERNGNLNYYVNSGSASAAMFADTAFDQTLGGIWIAEGSLNVGYTAPRVYDSPVSGEYELFLGHDNGQVWFYTDLEADLTDSFFFQTKKYSDLDHGSMSRLDIADLTGDGRPEVVVGNLRGGLTFFTDVEAPPSSVAPVESEIEFEWYPNPASEFVYLKPAQEGIYTAAIYDVTGRERLIYNELFGAQPLDISGLETGVYLLQLRQDGKFASRKLLVTK